MQIKHILLKGKYEQEVPLYSAVKVNGKKLYEYAREGLKVELPKREVQIFDIKLSSPIKRYDGKIIFSIECRVSKGTYIRSLVRDIALKLHTIGIMSKLRRVKQGRFSVENCKKIDDIRIKDMIGIRDLLSDLPTVTVDNGLKKDILNGKILDSLYNTNQVLFVDQNNFALAIYHIYDKDKTKLKPYIMIGGIK